MKIRYYTFAAIIITFSMSASAGVLQCGDDVIEVGDYEFEVWETCGGPLYTNGSTLVYDTLVDDWLDYAGVNSNPVVRVVIGNGKVRSINEQKQPIR